MDIVCFSHLRWDFVYQRPQHLMQRFAKSARVFYIEEPFFNANADAVLSKKTPENVLNIQLHLTGSNDGESLIERQASLLQSFFRANKIEVYIFWFYTPMALPVAAFFTPQLFVYDCMDELSAFKFAPPVLKKLEKELLNKADVVFTGGQSLYEAKKEQHRNIHSFPSSIDKPHFAKARSITVDPADQASIPHPRLGFYGVLDERFDVGLIKFIAETKPEWQLVLIGPVVKIEPSTLPRLPNIHYLGGKSYNDLPTYLAGWDIAMISFALNESTRYISPTKTPEYLAAGKPVISTPITDVVNPYGNLGLVHIAHSPQAFVQKAALELARINKESWLKEVDLFLANISWDKTAAAMMDEMHKCINQNLGQLQKTKENLYV